MLAPHTKATIYSGLQQLMNLVSPGRLRTALMHPMPSETTKKLVEIINRRLQDPKNNPPLRIMTFGGSILEGTQSAMFRKGNISLEGSQHFARLSSQLQIVLDEVIFPKSPDSVVEVTNMAVGGMSSNLATILLDYSLWPDGYPRQGPDMIIAAFGYNDKSLFFSPRKDKEQAYNDLYKSSEQFLRSAYASRCDDLPAVVMVDDSFTTENWDVQSNLLHSRAVSELATWYKVMTVSYTRAFLHYTYSDPTLPVGGDIGADRLFKEILWGDPTFRSHPAIFFHTGLAWLLVLQLLESIGDNCQDEEYGFDDLRNTTELTELNARHMPRLSSKMMHVTASEWKNATKEYQQMCSGPDYLPGNSCSYQWIVHRASPVNTKYDVRNIMSLVTKSNTGWVADGKPVRPPRAGWVATKANASFQMAVVAKELPIRTVSVLYMNPTVGSGLAPD
jgi:hypothetical protein